ncbi:hypothetical protein N9L68_00975 [bacterium]|nr:hypothetical protein [bacterium]
MSDELRGARVPVRPFVEDRSPADGEVSRSERADDVVDVDAVDAEAERIAVEERECFGDDDEEDGDDDNRGYAEEGDRTPRDERAEVEAEEMLCGDCVDAGEDEEGAKPRTCRKPKLPSKKEIEEHEATHLPFRSWCRFCVRGRGRNTPHRGHEGVEEDDFVPRIALDYHFISQADEAASSNPVLTMVDSSVGAVFARAAGQKGVGRDGEVEWLIASVVSELDAWGYRGQEVIIRCDQETSIESFRSAVAEVRVGKTLPESTPKGESQANGRVEEAGKRVREMVRTLKDQLEHHTGEAIEAGCPVLQWLVRWAAMLCTRYSIGRDGQTAHERMRGRKCNSLVIPFGEAVLYKELKSSGGPSNKLQSTWHDGIWLGQADKSNESLIGTEGGVIRSWAVRRKPDSERWDGVLLKKVCGTPNQPIPGRSGWYIPIRVEIDMPEGGDVEEAEPRRKEEVPRRVYLKRKHFEKHGFTEACEGCRRMRAGHGVVGHRAHTLRCRRRMYYAMARDDEDRPWLERTLRRHEAFLESSGLNEEPRGAAIAAEAAAEVAEDHEENRDLEGRRPAGLIPSAMRRADEREESDEARRGGEEGGEGSAQVRSLAEKTFSKMMLKILSGADISEIYSPERVISEARRFGLQAGLAMDLLTGWDFNNPEDRTRAETHQNSVKPLLLIGSPMCTMFSALQSLSGWNAAKQKHFEESCGHVRWTFKLYQRQLDEGRLFLHEHPANASSWKLPFVKELMQKEGVFTVVADQCMFGQVAKSRRGKVEGIARKRTRFVTNSWWIADALNRRCNGNHAHVPLLDGKALQAAEYPAEMCRAICRGLLREKDDRAMHVSPVLSIRSLQKGTKLPNAEEHHDEEEIRVIQQNVISVEA